MEPDRATDITLVQSWLAGRKTGGPGRIDAAAANYQYVVLESLRNVADVLRVLENDAQRLAALSVADVAAQGSLESMQPQYALSRTQFTSGSDVLSFGCV